MQKYYSISYIVILLLLCAGLQGEESVALNYAVIEWKDRGGALEKRDDMFLYTGGTYQKIHSGNGEPGKTQTYRGSAIAPVFRKVVAERGEAFKKVGECKFPTNSKKALVFVFYESSGSNADFNMVGVDISKSKLRPGHLMFLNLSGVECAAMVQDQPFKLEFGKSKICKTVVNETFQLPITVAVFDEKRSKWKQACKTVTRIVNDKSYAVVFYKKAGTRASWKLKVLRNLSMI